MPDNYTNAMEELARASMMIRDLAKGIVGQVLIEAPAFVVPTEEDFEEHRLAVEEIHQGQRDMARLGWHRAPDAYAKLIQGRNHNTSTACWFKNDHEKKETLWIKCRITTRFGLRALFWNTIDPGERMVGPEELASIFENR